MNYHQSIAKQKSRKTKPTDQIHLSSPSTVSLDAPFEFFSARLIDPAEPTAPSSASAIVILVDCDGVREGVRLGGQDRRDVFFVGVDRGDDFHDGGKKSGFHCFPDFGTLCLKPLISALVYTQSNRQYRN